MITVQVPKGFSSKEPLPNSDGWIPWNGGECPVPLDTKVEVSCRGPYPTSTGIARDFSWGHLEMLYDTDIVSYRVIKEESKDEGWIPWSGGECPVPGGTRVEVKLRDEVSDEYMKGGAVCFEWRYDDEFPESDIVAYRVLPQYNPEDVVFKDKAPPPRDTQVGGTHYAEMKIQPWDAINVWSTPEMVLGYHINTSVSYLARFRAKGGLQDIRKAHHHLSELIRYFEEEEEYPF
jgi:hypothetical protein